MASQPAERAVSADRPVTSLADDELGFAKYAYILARFIANCEPPMTVGIHGEWGSGKTSLANLIRCFLLPRDEKEWSAGGELNDIRESLEASGHDLSEQLPSELLSGIEIIDLNAWQYTSAQSLWRALILRLLGRLEELGLGSDVSQWRQRLYYSVSRESKGEIHLNSVGVEFPPNSGYKEKTV
jgi:predicted KAP-like P-loop ATPase